MIIEEPRVQPECHADTLLLQMILGRTVTHVPGNGNIANIFKSNNYDRKNLVCITDDDTKKPEVFNKLTLEKRYPYNDPYLFLKRKPGTNLYLIIIHPDLENWILKCCDDINFDRSLYPSLLKNLKSLKEAFKDQNVSKNVEVKNFLNSLIVRKSPPPLITKLKTWIHKKLL